MKKLVISLCLMMIASWTMGQTVLYQEDFEGTPQLTQEGGSTWAVSSNWYYDGVKSDTISISSRLDTSFLMTPTIDISSNPFVLLSFAQICKAADGDAAYVEAAVDGGEWVRLTSSEYRGEALFINNQFTIQSYTLDWDPDNPSSAPLNTMWKKESFDLSSLCTGASTLQLRFAIFDGDDYLIPNNHSWLLDDILVSGSADELVPPVIELAVPLVIGNMTGNGPFTVYANITDASGLDSVALVYTVDGGAEQVVEMSLQNGALYAGDISSIPYESSIDYHIVAIDASANKNTRVSESYNFVTQRPSDSVRVGLESKLADVPFNPSNKNCVTQSIYLASDVARNGFIQKLYWNFNQDKNAVMEKDIDVYFGTTEKDRYVSGLDWVPFDQLTKVFSGTIIADSTTEWVEIILDTPYYYSGIENLVIGVDLNSVQGFDNAEFYSSTTVNNRSLYAYQADNDIDPIGIPEADDVLDKIPNAIFKFDGQIPDNDAGIFDVVNPYDGIPAGMTDVVVKVKNFGVNELTSTQIHWSVDGVEKTPYPFVGNIPEGVVSDEIVIGNLNITEGDHTIKIWTSLPNGQADEVAVNDTMVVNFYVCQDVLNGTFTIGAGQDYERFYDAAMALTRCGIEGPVTFNVASGTYNEQLSLSDIPGISETNTVTFQSASGNAADVVLSYAATSEIDNYVVKLQGTDHIVLKNMTIQSTGDSFSRVIATFGEVVDLTISGNTIIGYDGVGTWVNQALYYSDELSNDSLVSITNNTFKYGSAAVFLRGQYSYVGGEVFSFENNTLEDQYRFGMYVKGVANAEIRSNTIKVTASKEIYDEYVAIDLYYNFGSYTVDANTIVLHDNAIGILSEENANYPDINRVISNNFITIYTHPIADAIFEAKGIQIYASRFDNVLYNSINMVAEGTSEIEPQNACLYLDYSSGVNIRNNNLVNAAKGQAIVIKSSSASSDYNNLYSKADVLADLNGAKYNNLSQIQGVTEVEANSISVDPSYTSETNLHVSTPLLESKGTPLLDYVTTDIDGDVRNETTPDIGADEFTARLYDIAASGFAAPLNNNCANAAEQVTVVVKNQGAMDWDFSVYPAELHITATGVNPVSFPVKTINSGVISTFESMEVVVADVYDMSAAGEYAFEGYLVSDYDTNQINDTLGAFELIKTEAESLPQLVDFTGFDGGNLAEVFPGWKEAADRNVAPGYEAWRDISDIVFEGNTSAMITFGSGNISDWIVSPKMEINNPTNFKYNIAIKEDYWGEAPVLGDDDTLGVMISVDCGENWEFLKYYTHTADLSSAFTEEQIDLTPYIGGQVYVAFYATTNDTENSQWNPAFYIDDIEIYEPFANDLAVKQIYSAGQLPLDAGTPHVVQAVIENIGYQDVTGRNVTLTVEGDNNFTDSKIVDLTVGEKILVTFADFTPSVVGNDTIYVTLDADDAIDNNEKQWNQVVTSDVYAYADDANPLSEIKLSSSTTLAGVKYQVNDLRRVNGVLVYIPDNNNLEDSEIKGFVLDENAEVITKIQEHVIALGDLGKWITLSLEDTTKTINNAACYVALSQFRWTSDHLFAAQYESPVRNNAFFKITDNNGAFEMEEDTVTGRYMIALDLAAPVAVDAELVEVSAPATSCGLTEETVSVVIRNNGSQDLTTGLTTYYQINDGPVVSEAVASPVVSGATYEHTFATPYDFTPVAKDSAFEVKAWVTIAADEVEVNDTVMFTVVSGFVPENPSVADVDNVPYATSTVLNVSSADSVYWYESDLADAPLYIGGAYETELLYDTTTYYVSAVHWGNKGIQVGNGDFLSTNLPVSSSTNYNWSATLYKKEEIGVKGLITSLSYDLNSGAPIYLSDQRIYIVATDKENLDGLIQYSYYSALIAEEDIVYSGLVNFTQDGWNAIELDNAFEYDGESNLIVFWLNNIGSSGTGVKFNATNSAEVMTIAADQWNAIPTSGNEYNRRANTIFGMFAEGCESDRVPLTVNVSNIEDTDAGVAAVVAPQSGFGLSENSLVTVDVKNFGNADVANFDVNYQLNGGAVVTETINATLTSGELFEFTFTSAEDLSAEGMYELKVWTSLNGDMLNDNDTLTVMIESISFDYCISEPVYSGGADISMIMIGNYENGEITDQELAFGTYSDYTNLSPIPMVAGNTYDMTVYQHGNDDGVAVLDAYIDYDRNSQFDGDEALLVQKKMITSAYSTMFTVPADAEVMNPTRLRVKLDEAFSNGICNDLDYNKYYRGETEDYAVTIYPQEPKDAGVVNIELAEGIVEGENAEIKIHVHNYGSETITAMDIAYMVNGQAPITEAWTGTLLPNENVAVTVNQVLPLGDVEICAYPELTGDAYAFNDQFCTETYVIPSYDLVMEAYVLPEDKLCSGDYNVVVRVANKGALPFDFTVNAMNITVDITGANAVTLTKTVAKAGLEPGFSFDISMGTVAMSATGYCDFTAYVKHVDDGMTKNDTLTMDSVLIYPDIQALPFVENFETGVNETFNEDELLDLGGWLYNEVVVAPNEGVDGSYALRLKAGAGGGTFSTASADTTDMDFWYYNQDFQPAATICQVDPQGKNLMMSFDLRMIYDDQPSSCTFGLFVDGVHKADINGTKFFRPETQNDAYQNVKFYLDGYENPFSVQLRAVVKTSSEENFRALYKGDNVYIDNLEITEAPAADIRLKKLTDITSTAVLNDQKQVSVTFENAGAAPISSVPLAYTINGGAKVSETWTGTLAPFASATHTFTVPVTYDIEDFFDVHVYAELADDADRRNDTLLKECRGVELLQLPYEEDFADATSLYAHPTSQWERGIANGNTITSTGNVWATQLDAGYLSDREDYLYTPYFDFSTVTDMEFELIHNYDMPLFEDAALIEYSVDGEVWELVEYRDSSLNWYNDYYYFIESDVWSRSSEGWIESGVDLDDLAAIDEPVQFRFRFVAEPGDRSATDGWGIASFGVVIPDPDYDMEVLGISLPTETEVSVGEPITLEFTIRNNGVNAVDSLGIGYTINGVEYMESLKLSNPIVQEQIVSLTISDEIFAPEEDFELCAKVSLPKDEKPENDTKCVNMTVTKADYDAALTAIVNPTNASEVGKYIFPVVTIQNNGLQTLTAFDVYFNINNGISQTESWTGSLAPGESIDYTFTTEYAKVPSGLYAFCAIVDMATDQYTANDTLCVELGSNGINDMNENVFELYQNMPNPTNGELSIAFQLPQSSEVNFEITNMLGQTVYAASIEAIAGMNKVEMDVNRWEAGVYYYSVEFEGVRKTMKMMITK